MLNEQEEQGYLADIEEAHARPIALNIWTSADGV